MNKTKFLGVLVLIVVVLSCKKEDVQVVENDKLISATLIYRFQLNHRVTFFREIVYQGIARKHVPATCHYHTGELFFSLYDMGNLRKIVNLPVLIIDKEYG